MAEKLYSKNFIKNLIIVETLRDTDYRHPKNTKQILNEVQERWKKFFPADAEENELFDENKFNVTIWRHIQDMNQSGLYEIRTCRQKQRGYFNATGSVDDENFIFTQEEFALIAMTLQRTSSISRSETEKILRKFENLVDMRDELFNKFFNKQINRCRELTSKTTKGTLPTLREILDALTNKKQIRFKLYDPAYLNAPNTSPKFLKIRQNFKTPQEISKARDKVFTVSPCSLTCDNGECYLVAYDANENFDAKTRPLRFPLSLIGNLKILDENIISPTPFESDSPKLKVTIYFKKNFLYDLTRQFGTRQKYSPIPNRRAGEEMDFQAIINITDFNGVYQWFLQNSDSVKIISPQKVRDNLKAHIKKVWHSLTPANDLDAA